MEKTIEDNQNEWDSLLPKALFAYRTAVQDTTHFSSHVWMLHTKFS